MKQAGSPPKPTKLYRGARQRHWGKWVVEIRLPKNRTWLWLSLANATPVDAKIQPICESLANAPPKTEKQSKKSKKAEAGLKKKKKQEEEMVVESPWFSFSSSSCSTRSPFSTFYSCSYVLVSSYFYFLIFNSYFFLWLKLRNKHFKL